MLKWLRNVSIAKKLYFTVDLMATLIVIELFTLQFAKQRMHSRLIFPVKVFCDKPVTDDHTQAD